MNTFTKTTIKSIVLLSAMVASLVLLVACGGDGLGGTGITPTVANGTLVRSDEEKLSTYFQNSFQQQQTETPSIITNDTANASEDGGANGGSGDDSQSSSTNIQEAGVDEADLIKTNGRYIYSIKKPASFFPKFNNGGIANSELAEDVSPKIPSLTSDVIRIMDTQGSGGLTEIKRLSSDEQANETPWSIAGIYLHEAEKRLIALTSAKQNYYANWFDSGYFSNQETKVLLIDVNTPETSKVESTLNFEGQLISSRRNGDTLYMILRHYPDYQFVDDTELSTTTSGDFLPTYRVDNGTKQLITQAKDCYVEADQKGSADVITLVAIDLKSATPQINSQCYVGSAEALYASQNALYLATTRWDYQTSNGIAAYGSKITTDIHKFGYSGLNFDYRGSAEIEGHLGFKQDNKSFRFSENQGVLRVITVDEDQWATIALPAVDGGAVTSTDGTGTDENTSPPTELKSPVSLTILEEDSTKKALKIVSKLPNTNRPAPIGLPNEQLYATRFIGNRAYVVTFRVTDPLYVLDLSNPADPFIAGELKVDGYSDYLHPISENLLLGIGKDAIPSGSNGDGRGALYQGVKLSLIDISDPTNPLEADKVVLGKRGTESAVLFDHHALTSLKVADTFRVAIPVQLHEDASPIFDGGDPASHYHQFKQTGLYRFEVDISSQKINQIPAIIVSDSSSEPSSIHAIYDDRSVIINDDVYYVHGGEFWFQDWQGTKAIVGPK